MQDLLNEVARRWQEDRLELATPASSGEVAAFEDRYSVRLPSDVRLYFTTLNGSRYGSDGDMDDLLLSFWHLAQVHPLVEESEIPVSGVESGFVFADWSIFAHLHVVRLTPDVDNPAPVFVVYQDVAVLVAPSFREFLAHYVQRHEDVLFPGPPPGGTPKYGARAV